jgi:sphinganine-1-phosphate aldolase
MDIGEVGTKLLGRLNPRVARGLERYLTKVPAVRERLDREYAKMLAGMEPRLHPYREQVPGYSRLPASGLPREEILSQIEGLASRETPTWAEGFVSGAVYHGAPDHVEFMNRVYSLHSQTNPLHSDLWPSITKYEAEIVSMTAAMLGAGSAGGVRREGGGRRDTLRGGGPVCGVVTSGGTESIMLAMKTYRDWARAERRVTRPEVVAPVSAHPAFDKAAEAFGLRLIRTPVGADLRADVSAVRAALTRNTVAVAGSAPGFPHGVIDPIPELSELARSRGIGFHTDACLGGFVLPWARQLGYPVPAFDFSLPGVTSMSADTHKFGYAAKGTSVVLYRTPELRRHQYFVATDWPGGLYASPTMAGSRPGGLIAACWAAMVAIGEAGYLEATKALMEAGAAIRDGIEAVPELRVLGDPLWVIAFAAADPSRLDVYRVLDGMAHRGWSLIGLQKPPAVHLVVTLRHTQPGVADRFLADLRASVAEALAGPAGEGGMAPMYGMANTVPFRGFVGDLLRRYTDLLYEV